MMSLSLTSKHTNTMILFLLFLFSIFNMKKIFPIVSPPTFHLAPRSLCTTSFSANVEGKALDNIDLNQMSHRYVSGVLQKMNPRLPLIWSIAARMLIWVKKGSDSTWKFLCLRSWKLSIAGRSGILDVLGDYLTAMTGVFSYGGRRPSQNVYLV